MHEGLLYALCAPSPLLKRPLKARFCSQAWAGCCLQATGSGLRAPATRAPAGCPGPEASISAGLSSRACDNSPGIRCGLHNPLLSDGWRLQEQKDSASRCCLPALAFRRSAVAVGASHISCASTRPICFAEAAKVSVASSAKSSPNFVGAGVRASVPDLEPRTLLPGGLTCQA